METPKFKHDCKHCKFLGSHDGYDLYFCDTTVVARFGNEDPQYTSGMPFAKPGHILFEAKKRAIELGFLKKD